MEYMSTRTLKSPPTPELLSLNYKMGLIVMDEIKYMEQWDYKDSSITVKAADRFNY
jgi:hypothetical protein